MNNTVEALAIGNSFSRNANTYRELLNEADPEYKLNVTEACIGGCSLERHLTLALQNEAEPLNPDFKQYFSPQFMPDGRYGLKNLLQFKKWKYITIQQVSSLSDDISTYRPYASNLCSFIKKYCPYAEIIVHQTWADRADNARMTDAGKTQEQMYNGLNSAYTSIAAELGNLRIISLGDAFQIIREREDFRFEVDKKFDFNSVEYPELPEQPNALCIGWQWGKDKNGVFKLSYDHHATPAGCFLGALVWRQFFFPDLDVRENSFTPEGVSSESAKILRAVAYDTVKNKTKPNIAK